MCNHRNRERQKQFVVKTVQQGTKFRGQLSFIRKEPNKHREERKLNMKKKKIYLRRKVTQNKM